MIRAIVSLVGHRLRGRASAVILLAGAVAAATGVTGTVTALGLSAADQALARDLASLPATERALRVSGYAPSAEGAAALDPVAVDAISRAAGFADPLERGVILRRVRDPATPYDLQLVAVDGVARSISLIEGTAPGACDGNRCDAVLLSTSEAPADLPTVLHVGTLVVRVVGRATLASPVPLGVLDERGPGLPPSDPYSQTTDAPPALLLVDGVRAVAAASGSGAVGRTYLWTAPLRVGTIHPWTATSFQGLLDGARAGLATGAPDLSFSAPSQTIDEALALARANDARLLLVGALAAAILIAFAAYAALLDRRDLGHELERLTAAGAGRSSRALLVALEAAGPTLIGATVGWVGALALAPFVAPGATGDGGAVAIHSLLAAGGIVAGLAVAGAALGAVILGLVGRAPRGTVGGLVPGLLVATLLVGWRLAGGLDATDLGGTTDLPVVALLPALVGLAVAGVALAVVPGLLRRLARSGRRAALPVRLALLSVAREPTRPAATLTLLAFGLGGLVFAVSDAATLARGTSDQAAFRAGLDLRVVEGGTDLTLSATVVPLDRYASLGSGVRTFPLAHAEAEAGGSTPLTVLGVVPEAIPLLRDWRTDTSASSPAELAAAIDLPGTFEVPGHRLDPTTTDLAIEVVVAGDSVDLSAVVAADGGDATRVFLGTARPGRSTLHGRLPDAAVGGRVIAMIVAEDRLIAGQDHPAKLGRATLRFPGLTGLLEDRPVDVQVSGLDKAILRAPLATDGLVLPAILSPDLAALAAASPDGTIPITVADRPLTRVRAAAVADRFPTLTDPGRSFAVVALDPLLVALDGGSPGAGHPDEAWVRIDPPASTSATIAALRSEAFRSPAIVSRLALEDASRSDPFSISIVAAFAAAGFAGLLLAMLGLVLGTLTDLRDETGELRDLEAQGLGPRALRRQVTFRTTVLAIGGVVAGLAVGIVLVAVVTATVAVGADIHRPMPPLALEIPWPAIVGAVAVPLAAAAVLAWLAGRWAFRRSARAVAAAAARRPAPTTGTSS